MTEPAAPETPASSSAGGRPASPYQVLARKYRPTTFAELIGQQAMVRTLTNAIKAGRLAHAFILTGVRGVGKTTTARIIARALNCVGPDGTGGPTVEPCGACEHCRAIAEDRHVDVLEMDAASRTGVDDIREIIDGVVYRPTSARYKVYIIDEVHMLSKNAFNALLKTLEEPPEHVKFIFATTEIRRVPVTVLSRCQRFDLRRVEMEALITHFASVADREDARVDKAALALIARAADGSVRDGLSLLDQAIAHCGGEVRAEQVRDMLGLADRGATFDLFDAVMRGDMKAALAMVGEQYTAGADPAVILEDMLELAHWLTRLKVVPEAADGPAISEAERVRGRDMAGRLGMAALARAWQMLLKGLGEVRTAPSPIQAAEMVLVRLAYAAELPSPADAVKALGGGAQGAGAAPAGPFIPPTPLTPGTVNGGRSPVQAAAGAPAPLARAAAEPVRAAAPPVEAPAEALPDPRSFEAVVELAGDKREGLLRANLINNVHLVRFEPGRIEFNPGEHAPADLANQLSRFLNQWTGRRWVVTVSRAPGQPTLRQQQAAEDAARRASAADHPLVKAILATFPGASVEEVRTVVPSDVPPAEAPDAEPANGEDE